MRDCVSENNAGAGYVAYLSPLDATSAPVSLRLENCRAIGNGGLACGIFTGNTPAQALTGRAEFIHCTFQGGKGAGFQMGGNPATAIQILVQNCSILDVAQDSPATNPIIFSAGQDATQDPGGVQFVDCLVRDPLGRKPMGFFDNSGSLRLAGVTGNLILETKSTKTSVTLTPELLGQWMPAITLKRYPRRSSEVRRSSHSPRPHPPTGIPSASCACAARPTWFSTPREARTSLCDCTTAKSATTPAVRARSPSRTGPANPSPKARSSFSRRVSSASRPRQPARIASRSPPTATTSES